MTQTDPNAAPLTEDQILQAILAAGNTGGAGIGLSKGEKPVGVQTGTTGGGHPGMSFVPGNATQFGTPVNKNPYQDGDEYKPGDAPQANVQAMVYSLVQAGLLSPTDVRNNGAFWDNKAASAYRVVLAYANTHAMSAKDALNVFLANPVQTPTGYRAPKPLTNPLESEAQFANVSQGLTGGGLPASESQDFATYQTGLENQAVSRYTSGKTDKTSSYVDAPSPTAGARAYILAHNPQDVVNYDMALRTVQFQNALKEL